MGCVLLAGVLDGGDSMLSPLTILQLCYVKVLRLVSRFFFWIHCMNMYVCLSSKIRMQILLVFRG